MKNLYRVASLWDVIYLPKIQKISKNCIKSFTYLRDKNKQSGRALNCCFTPQTPSTVGTWLGSCSKLGPQTTFPTWMMETNHLSYHCYFPRLTISSQLELRTKNNIKRRHLLFRTLIVALTS